MEPVIKQLDSSVVNILCSAQVITSPSSVIKELIENALDANATNIDVKLEAFGLDRIEVRDNGTGVKPDDARCMAASHFTSKLSGYNDLGHITSYGFRGEALSSISNIGDLTIATKFAEEVGISYKYDHCGNVIAQNPIAMNQGTSVIITKLFKTLPVRRQYYTSINKRKEEIKAVENHLKAYSIINCGVRFSLYHDRNLIWQKGRSDDIKSSLQQVFGISLLKSLEAIHYKSPDDKIQISAFLPKRDSNVQIMSHSQPDMTFVFVNRRPVVLKFANKILRSCYSAGHGLLTSQMKYPIGCLCIQVPTETIDVNIDPSKSQVYFHSKEEVKKAIHSLLGNIYELPDTPATQLTNSTNPVPHSTCTLNGKTIEKSISLLKDKPVYDKPATVYQQEPCRQLSCSSSTLLDDDLGSGWEIIMDETEVAYNNGIKETNALPLPVNDKHEVRPSSQNGCDATLASNHHINTKSDNLTTSQWSKGCIRDSTGEIVKPPQICVGKDKKLSLTNAVPELEIIDCPMKKKARVDHYTDLTMDNFLEISSRNENPTTQISPNFDTNKGNQPTKVLQARTMRQETKKSASQKLQSVGEKMKNKLSFFKKDGQDSPTMRADKSEPIKSVVAQFNFDQTKAHLLVDQSCSPSQSSVCDGKDKTEVIGELDNGFWIVLQEKELKILNHHRLSETLLYQRLMEYHAIAKENLEQPIVLSRSTLGEKEWHALMKLKVGTDATLSILDDRIVKNGFGIKRYEDAAGISCQLMLVEIANNMPFYGVSELKECLAHIASNPATTLSESRPMKVVNYLKSEAIRMARAMPNHKSKDDLLAMLKTAAENLPQDLNRCCHGQPFFTAMYNLENIPEIKGEE